MARKKKTDGFSMDNIVDTMIQDNINDNVPVKVNDNINDNIGVNVNILSELKQKAEPEKVRVQLYLDQDVNNLLDHYGKKLGKANGGKSKFTTEVLRRFLEENQLWIDEIADSE